MFIFFFLISCNLKSQNVIEISIPESYELSNIILALTDYGINDNWEVQKHSRYYKDVITFFEPVKNHLLLKKVNYSRLLWEDYLSFRTDAVAFTIDKNNLLKRESGFHANHGHKPFDKNLKLINDFITQSNFRIFYNNHRSFYDSIIHNYSNYYMLNEMMDFLKTECGIIKKVHNNINTK